MITEKLVDDLFMYFIHDGPLPITATGVLSFILLITISGVVIAFHMRKFDLFQATFDINHITDPIERQNYYYAALLKAQEFYKAGILFHNDFCVHTLLNKMQYSDRFTNMFSTFFKGQWADSLYYFRSICSVSFVKNPRSEPITIIQVRTFNEMEKMISLRKGVFKQFSSMKPTLLSSVMIPISPTEYIAYGDAAYAYLATVAAASKHTKIMNIADYCKLNLTTSMKTELKSCSIGKAFPTHTDDFHKFCQSMFESKSNKDIVRLIIIGEHKYTLKREKLEVSDVDIAALAATELVISEIDADKSETGSEQSLSESNTDTDDLIDNDNTITHSVDHENNVSSDKKTADPNNSAKNINLNEVPTLSQRMSEDFPTKIALNTKHNTGNKVAMEPKTQEIQTNNSDLHLLKVTNSVLNAVFDALEDVVDCDSGAEAYIPETDIPKILIPLEGHVDKRDRTATFQPLLQTVMTSGTFEIKKPKNKDQKKKEKGKPERNEEKDKTPDQDYKANPRRGNRNTYRNKSHNMSNAAKALHNCKK